MTNHTFDPLVAKDVGLNAAVIYKNLQFWISKNKSNKRHFYDGFYWSYNSMAAFDDQFVYLTKDQIRRALEKLIDCGYIKKGNFNKTGYDRTLWYCDLCPNHLANLPNQYGSNPSPIPYSKPDSNTYNPPNPQGDDVQSSLLDNNNKDIFEALWLHLKETLPIEILPRHKKKPALTNFLKACNKTSAKDIDQAIRYMLTLNQYSQKEFQYLAGLHRLIKNEDYEPFLGRKVDTRSKFEIRREQEMMSHAAKYKRTGDMDIIASQVPEEHRRFWPQAAWDKFGWGK